MFRKYIKPIYKCDNCFNIKNKDELSFIKETLEYVCCEDCRQSSLKAKSFSNFCNLINEWWIFNDLLIKN